MKLTNELAHKLLECCEKAYDVPTGKHSNDQWYIEEIEGYFVIAFAGSNDLPDWLENIWAWSTKTKKARVHRRWHKRVKSIKNHLEAFQGRNVIFTGHSLGGALAQLMLLETQELDANKERFNAVTFASPKPIKKFYSEWRELLFRFHTYHFINPCDGVTKTPPSYNCYGIEHVWREAMRGTEHPLSNYKTVINHALPK